MKKIIVMLLAAVLLLSLCACGADVPEGNAELQITAKPKTEETTGETTIPEKTTGDVTTPEDTTEATTEATTEPEKENTTDGSADKKALAAGCVGKNVSELYALIGQPKSSDYAPSCLVDGEDGMLYYDGFVVYTTRENGVETVYYVE